MSTEKEHIDKNVRKNIFIPLAYSLLWIIGLSVTLYLTLFNTKLSGADVEIQTVFKCGVVFILFLWEIVFGFLDIADFHSNKQFNSKVFKTMGYILGDIALTIVLVVCYITLKQMFFLIFFFFTIAFLKYIYVYMTKNVETYFAKNIHRPNFVNHGK